MIIIVGVVFYFFQNKEEDYSYLEIQNVETVNEIKETKQEIVVHVTGQVIYQGIVKLEEGSRIIDAIEAAGGATNEANLSKINLAYILEDGMKIYIPSVNDKEEDEEYVSSDESTSTSNSSKETLKVNINTATSEELERLPGIGSSIAARIIEYRKGNGNFSKIEDIKNVSGIGDAKFNNIKNYIYVK